jgi:UDP-N-acetyl-2-amino-2-deoxyglucuronate dehydrogenase
VAKKSSRGGKLRFGIIGCGSIGPTHAAALSRINDAELIAVADLDAERAQSMATKFSVGRVYESDRELLSDPEIDIVSICTPSGMHADHAITAMQAGKHVIVEKPMDITLKAADRMIAAERKFGRKLTIISQHRFDPATIQVKELIESGKLGKIILADMAVKWWRDQRYYDSGDWRGTWKLDGGGALMNQGVHTVDLLQWLAGGVSSVFAHTRTACHERIEVEDIAVAALTFENGAIGTLTATTAAYKGFPVRIELHGTEGSAVIEGDHLKCVMFRNGQQLDGKHPAHHALSVAQGGTASVKHDAAKAPPADKSSQWGDAHKGQIENFMQAIRTNGKPLIDGTAGRRPLEIILGVYQSARTGKPVTLTHNGKAKK